jgi:hypothetical protein
MQDNMTPGPLLFGTQKFNLTNGTSKNDISNLMLMTESFYLNKKSNNDVQLPYISKKLPLAGSAKKLTSNKVLTVIPPQVSVLDQSFVKKN